MFSWCFLSGPSIKPPPLLEVRVPYSDVLEAEISMETVLHVGSKPRLESYDSGQECSFEHLRELYKLLDVQDLDLEGYVFDDSCLHVA